MKLRNALALAVLVALTLVSFAVTGSARTSQEAGGFEANAQDDPLAMTEIQFRWVGKVRDDLDPVSASLLSLPDQDLALQVERAAARILLQFRADRDYAQASRHASALGVRLAEASTRGQAGSSRAYRLRYELALEAGDWEAFDKVGPGYATVQEIERFVEVEQMNGMVYTAAVLDMLEHTEEMQALRRRGDELRGKGASSSLATDRASYHDFLEGLGTPYPGEDLEGVLMAALEMQDLSELKSMGAPAFAVAAGHVLEQLAPDPNIDYELWAFDALVHLDQAKALRLYADWFNAATPVWRQRAFQACRDHGDLQWLPVGSLEPDEELRDSRLWDPTWLELIASFLGDAAMAPQSGYFVNALAAEDGIAEPVTGALGDCLASDDRLLAAMVIDGLDRSHRVPSAVSALVRGLESEHVDVRRTCVGLLAKWGALHEARLGLGDEDASVVRAALAGFGWVEYSYIGPTATLWRGRAGAFVDEDELAAFQRVLDRPELREDALAALTGATFEPEGLRALLESAHPELRLRAVELMEDMPDLRWALPALLADPDPSVRAALVNDGADRPRLRGWDQGQWVQVLGRLVNDPDGAVRAAVDHTLSDGYLRKALPGDGYVGVLEAVLPLRFAVDGRSPLSTGPEDPAWDQWAERWNLDFYRSPFVLEFALDQGLEALVAQQLEATIPTWEAAAHRRTNGRMSNPSPVPDAAAALRTLSLERRLILYSMKLHTQPARHFDNQPWTRASWRGHILRAAPLEPSPDLEAMTLAIDRGRHTESWLLRVAGHRSADEAWTAFCVGLVTDRELPFELRVRAAVGADLSSSEDGLEFYRGLANEALAHGITDPEAFERLGAIVAAMPDRDRVLLETLDRFASQPLEHRALFALPVVEQLGPEPDACLRRVLTEFGLAEDRDEWSLDCAYTALGFLSEARPTDETMALVVRLAEDVELAGVVADVLVTHPTRANLDLVFRMIDEPRYAQVREHALYTLQDCVADDAYEGLRVRIPTMPRELRDSAMNVLSEMADARAILVDLATPELPTRDQAIAELLDMLGDPDPTVRKAAVRGLAGFGSLEALPTLIRMLTTEQDQGVLDELESAIHRLTEVGGD